METIDNLMIDDSDLEGSYDWHEAKEQIELLNSQAYKGFNYWRLPTKEELNVMYVNKNEIGGFSTYSYWSSSEYNAIYAWFQYFYNGYQSSHNKYDYGLVRCVRSV